ncbi:hypothetical protein CMV_025063 [Castanea mollissima]|uniref:F-box domain-containing protein n=1 Tax=Castanea mollissima TaxID=60419 RepID=A0A8J4QM50_9ROSI|nr:hypothetical protein CMV_025063 [Castanea mollissima]
MCPRGRGLVENEEQYENKKMKSIVVEEQEEEEEEGSGSERETGFVDLNQDMLHNVLKFVDMVTLGRAACVNKLWSKVALDDRLWAPFIIYRRRGLPWAFHRMILRPPPIDPQVFSRQIEPWV